jgi:hypothetical protein
MGSVNGIVISGLTALIYFGILPGMARKIRIQYPGAVYHVMNRWDRRETVFKEGQDCEVLLRKLEEACGIALWRVQAKNLHVFGRAALLRRPRVQGRAAALPYQEGKDLRPAPALWQAYDYCLMRSHFHDYAIN